MKTLKGTCASGGVATGRIKIMKGEDERIKKYTVENVAKEIERFNEAVEKTKEKLGVLYEKTLKNATDEEAEIFAIHIMMLEDGGLTGCCESIIYEQSINAEYAIEEAAEVFTATLLETNDEYVMARTADIKDIKTSILASLSGKKEKIELDVNTVIFAKDLTPSQTINLDKKKIAAFVTENGAKNSHTAILARSMKIPSLVNTSGCIKEEFEGKMCIVDAGNEKVIIDPDEDSKNEFLENQEKMKMREEKLSKLKGRESITKNGKKIKLYANIGGLEDIDKVIENDAEGIGLFRSEFLYLGKEELPSETEQFEVYKSVLLKMQDKDVIIRTLDIGADKKAECLNLTPEENPALGYRAIRICLDDKVLFKTQLRALFRASIYGKLSIMFPMVTAEAEVISAIDAVNEVKRELKTEDIPYDENVKIGIMIETPAAALISERLAPLVDFFSIGTNDLIQYTLACDRQNEKIASVYNPHHEAVLKLIKITCENAHKSGIWVGICGELAADTEITSKLIESGADELSVSPPYVLPVRESIINSD